MYKIFADDTTLIYDGTLEDFKIGKGLITRETNKSGSFTFSVYPDHFFYDQFVKLKTVITVYKSGKIVFRGRVLNDVTDHWNNKVITCEGELGFLQDSIIRPFSFAGTPEKLFTKFLNWHNDQVDDFKKFKIGTVSVTAEDDIGRSNTAYESTLSNLNGKLLEEDSIGGYFYITHGEDGTDPIPTIHYLADFPNVSPQTVEFGVNLKDFTKTANADDIATVIIPLGAPVDDKDDTTENLPLTIADVTSDGSDCLVSENGVALYGRIVKVISFETITKATTLKRKGEAYLEKSLSQNVTIELNAIDLHLLDRSIESFSVGDYIRVISPPHNFDSTMLCNRQTLDLLNPENDSIVLGYTYATLSGISGKMSNAVSSVENVKSAVNTISNRLTVLDKNVADTVGSAQEALANYQNVTKTLGQVSGDLESVAAAVTDNARNISTNAGNIATNAENIAKNAEDIETINDTIAEHDASISDIIARLTVLEGTT